MKQTYRRWLAVLLTIAMVCTLLPATALAEEVDEATETAAQQVQTMINELPDAEEITAENRADVQAQIDAIDAAILELTESEAAALDTTRYEAAAASLLALDAPSALEQVQALIDALPDAESITDDNRADVEAQLTAIDEAKLELTNDEMDELDIARYLAAAEALLVLDDMAGADVPMPIAFPSELTGDGSSSTPYQISTPEQLKQLCEYVNGGHNCQNTYFELTQNIDLGGADNPWTPIGGDSQHFQGTFDGNNHTISGLNITSGNNQGLFGVIGNSGTVKNLTVKGNVTGTDNVGGIVGKSLGNIENCHNAASIKGGSYTGGIVGYMDGGASMQNCSNIATVNGGRNTGGLAGYGWIDGTIKNCYNTGNVVGGNSNNVGGITGYLKRGGTVKNCYNVGEITARDAGGVIGNNEGTVQSCFNYGTITGSGGPVRGNDRGVCSNCYYLDTTWNKEGRGAVSKSADQFASGEVAYLLQNAQDTSDPQVWGQKVGSGNPELTNDAAKMVYQITGIVEEQEDIVWYSNSKATLPSAPEKAGNTFSGWATTEGGEVDFTEGSDVTTDMRVYAVFVVENTSSAPSSYSVTVPQQPEHGSVEFPSRARPGSKVTVTVTPDEYFHVSGVIVTDRSGKEIPVTSNDDGTYTFTMPRGSISVDAVFTACGTHAFPDMDEGAWYHEYTDYVIANGLMAGPGYGIFDPLSTATRAQMTTVLWNLSGKPVVNYYMTYADVSEDAWYAEAIRWATSEGIVDGYNSDSFGPNDPVTREQMAVMLYRYDQKYGSGGLTGEWMYRLPYTDLDQISDWAFEAVAWCDMKDILGKRNDNLFDPKDIVARCDMAAVITRYALLDEEN